MVLPVVEPNSQVLDRVAGEDPITHRLLDSLLDRGDEPGRDDATLDLVHELVAGARGGRHDLDVAVTELSTTPGLLLVTPVRFRGLPHGFEVWDLRRFQVDLSPEATLHPLRNHLDVDLSEARDDLLPRLRVSVNAQGLILIGEQTQCDRGLFIV